MLQHYSHLETFNDGPASLMSLGPSPANGVPAPRRLAKPRHGPSLQPSAPAYLCPVPLKSHSPAPTTSARRRLQVGEPDKTQRQASEEISHILRRKENLVAYDVDQQFLDGSRSADMFVGKKHTGTSGVHHFATPPAGNSSDEEHDSDPDSEARVHVPREGSDDFLTLHELRDVMNSPSQSTVIRSASIQDLAVMADTSLTPIIRAQNPLPRSSPFVNQDTFTREGAEIGLLSFSPPSSTLDEDLKARRARFGAHQNTADFKARQRFGDLTPRGSGHY